MANRTRPNTVPGCPDFTYKEYSNPCYYFHSSITPGITEMVTSFGSHSIYSIKLFFFFTNSENFIHYLAYSDHIHPSFPVSNVSFSFSQDVLSLISTFKQDCPVRHGGTFTSQNLRGRGNGSLEFNANLVYIVSSKP